MKNIVTRKIKVEQELATAYSEASGAVVSFCGNVRNKNKGKGVSGIFYESYLSMAETMIEKIVVEAIQKFNLNFAKCIHRIGYVDINETAVLVLTSSAHRKEAYAANEYIIDRVKHEVPIWKKEQFVDGTEEWGTNTDTKRKDEKVLI